MTETNHEEYKKRVDELGKTLLNVIASVSQGNYNVKIDIPEDIEVFADLAHGLEFMIEDLRENPQGTGSISGSTPPFIESAPKSDHNDSLPGLSDSAIVRAIRQSRGDASEPSSFTYSRTSGLQPKSSWLPNMAAALESQRPSSETNGQDTQSLSLPIQLQDEVIGVIGFNRGKDHPWTAQEIATVESITEQLGLALENQRLFEQTQQALSETELLYKATAELNTARSYTDILYVLKEYSKLGAQSSQMHISLFDQTPNPEQPDAIMTIARIPEWLEAEGQGSINLFTSGSLANQLMTSDSVTVVENIITSKMLPQEVKDLFLTQADAQAVAFIPLVVGGQRIGVIDCFYPTPVSFSEDEVRRTASITAQASVAIQNLYSIEIAQQAVEEMREVDRLKSEFLANMSHELRTPLNSIIGFSRVILKGIDGPINDIQQQDLEAIHHSGQHLLDMINNILDISKIEAGKMELRVEEIELDDVIDSVISTTRGLVKEKPIKLLTEIPENLPMVSADRTRVRQILLNLLQNATKFTDHGSITIKIQPLLDSGEIKISVIDTGIGISNDDRDKLFERFSQVDSSLTRKVGGSGLGLSITKLLVEMQGGVIDMESEIGRGSEFWFTLPLVDSKSETDSQIESIDPEKKIIVSIDDDTQIVNLYKRYLRTHGYQVVGISEPTEVIQKIKEIQPFAITLDLMMPQKDGWQVIQEIKKDPETAHIPVIICSILEEKDRAYQLGAVDYLVKPILESELVAAVNNLQLAANQRGNIILVIDDDPNVFQLVEIALRDFERYHLHYANGGFQGLEQLNSLKPDAVILDLMMPDLDGFSILETMQGDANLRKTPVIILTAADLTPEQRETLEKNKKEVLNKDDFKSKHLIAFLENALNELETTEIK